jgi:hypothetical protein
MLRMVIFAMPSLKHSVLLLDVPLSGSLPLGSLPPDSSLLDTLFLLLLDFAVALESGFAEEDESESATSLELAGESSCVEFSCELVGIGSSCGPEDESEPHATSVKQKATAEAKETILADLKFILPHKKACTSKFKK